jgi:hypothetical protein
MFVPEHTTAVLTRDLPEHGLQAGDTGAVVQCNHAPGKRDQPLSYLLEIFAVDCSTIDVVETLADAVRRGLAQEVYHARSVAAE